MPCGPAVLAAGALLFAGPSPAVRVDSSSSRTVTASIVTLPCGPSLPSSASGCGVSLKRRSSAEREAIAEPMLPLLVTEPEPVNGDAVRVALGPVLWLLDGAASGIALT